MISIIVPVYNIKPYLHFCVDSILNQDSSNWELILVNDGSSDGSEDICLNYSLNNQQIKLVNKQNGGLSSARNAGLDVASGDWVLFVDGDDYLHPNTISVLENLISLIPYNVGLIQYGYQEVKEYCECQTENSINLKFDIVEDEREMFNRLLHIGGEAASGCTKLIRARDLDGLKFKEGIIHEDEEFVTRLLSSIKSICYCNFKPYMYVRRPSSITTSKFNPRRLDIIDIMKSRIDVLIQKGFTDIANKFRLKLVRNLWTMFMAASAAKEKASCARILKEIKTQIRLLDSSTDVSRYEKLRYFLECIGLPIMQLENMVRNINHKQIRYE